MGLFSIFSKSSPPDYETLLARLATDIAEAKTHLSEIRLRERRFSLLVNAYGVALWAIWTGLWWVNGLPLGLIGLSHYDLEGRVIALGGILGGPVFIYLLNRLVHLYFKRQRTHEETHLRLLLTQQRKHLEEIKKATNYDSTRKLIEQYDDPSGGGGARAGPPGSHPSPRTPQRRMPDSPSPAGAGGRNVGSPRAPGHLVGAGGTPAPIPGSPVPIPEGLSPDQAAALQMQIHAIQPVLPTPEKRWYDRVVDSILGEDPSQAAQSKYALVCGECFRHNGLIGSKYEWERMQWICPRCNHLNPPPISKLPSSQPSLQSEAQHYQSPSPASLPSPAPAPVKRAPTASPRARRQIGGDKSTPRSSRLSKEVFSASSEDEDDNEDADELDRGDKMDVDTEGK
ncbi:hypothetical protein CI109_100113 [Kwoniella shandongensis]|uniref:Endoplasmic reticulum junction formation protein lunapark n=1 Tax=Kwoniella shandongensis TaxID=1734106 RepID=A0A5M6BPL6_9TREE|nr:uncharacterized protein CI109_006859 [Kwoniella shandongensis]KAA5524836.1 hypothetical protein CI109_006859 [Kwoniella shandongensis]